MATAKAVKAKKKPVEIFYKHTFLNCVIIFWHPSLIWHCGRGHAIVVPSVAGSVLAADIVMPSVARKLAVHIVVPSSETAIRR